MIELHGVSKQFDTGLLAVSDVDLSIGASEIVAVIGPSGCGKSTILRLIAGLEKPSRGSVLVAGHSVSGPDRAVGIVFQQPRLMPWLSVERNVSFGLDGDAASNGVVAESIARVGLTEFASALPRELSGGMAQRTAIARALVTKPPVLLLDEPFSSLDAFTRIDLQQHLLDVWGWYRPTMFLVTHDIDEALVLADRVIVLRGRPGSIQAEMAVDLGRPRTRTDPAFHSLQDLAMKELSRSSQDPLDQPPLI
ncbi:MAG TPA: ABC transporter ATP-binding protein [Acidimicrobiia bacterium]|nr:ABC transporter ATP-binding protein [Acidimicrobiia bacterium]